jgi:polar amino acid transport system substrate-binding protein
LLERRFDLIASGLWITAPRALVVNFTSSTAVEGVYLVAGKKKAQHLKSQADFNRPGVTIAIYAGATQEALAKRAFPNATLIQVQDDPLKQVLGGYSHAALIPTLTPQVVINAAPGKLKLAAPNPIGTTSAAIAVRKGDPDFLSFLNTWLALQAEQGWLQERRNHWFVMSNWIK